MKNLKSITFEMSLKPFRSTKQEDIESVCFSLFDSWRALTKHADRICILLWVADGSEILEYTGRDEDEIEWGRYIGGANPRQGWDKVNDPQGLGLHTRWYYYTENPPVITNKILRQIISTLKKIGKEVTGKPVLVGETFDPGPEFAKSDFKYNRHNEICLGASMGHKSMVCCYATLKGDRHHYATYPDGIPDGTPFGTFLGKQAQRFLTDMGFDYLWLSNGFGFGSETWRVNGATFDGKNFYPEKMSDLQEKIMEFWRLFRKEFHLPVETRGTNLTAGIDFATDAVNLKKIYEGGFDILPPPNSPWAALDGDFGLELAGYMSRMAELPSGNLISGKTPDSYLFRFYIHDPWWMNSPWMDRYEGQPHDIYLPLATVRLNAQGQTVMPDHMNLLTVDNSLGEMPENCVNEVIPHLLKCFETAPDQPSPFVWVYPFREYHENPDSIAKAFFEDWFMVKTINSSLPVNTVISSDNFSALFSNNPGFLKNSVLVVPVPDKRNGLNQSLLEFVEHGGKVMLYGSLTNADSRLLEALNLKLTAPLSGEMTVKVQMQEDELVQGSYTTRIAYPGILSDGGVDTVIDDQTDSSTAVFAMAAQNQDKRVLLHTVSRPRWNGGGFVWCRGYSCSRAEKDKNMYPLARLFALAAGVFGYDFRLVRQNQTVKEPVVALHRNRNVCWYSGFNPNTTTDIHLKTPLGAPLLTGYETIIKDGRSVYRFPRAWRNECRVFVQQDGGVLGCKEMAPVSFTRCRRLVVSGLKNATVYVLPPCGDIEKTELLLNSKYPYFVGDPMGIQTVDTVFGQALCVKNISGDLLISDLFV